MTKIRETHQTPPQGMTATSRTLQRVRTLQEGETLPSPLPPNIEVLPEGDATPEHDWKEVTL